MKFVSRFKVSLALLAVWLANFLIYLFVSSGPTKYAATEAGARSLEKLMECDGGVYKYSLGYRCDYYAPTTLLWLIIIIGAVAFLGAIATFLWTLTTKPKSR